MAYTDKFVPADNLIGHLSGVIPTITDPIILASYIGFLSVSSVTVYELAIKEILNDFCSKKNKVFGIFSERHFGKINGRIKLDDLKGQHLKLFGDKYTRRFDARLRARQTTLLSTAHVSLVDCYNNLILCRHQYVHGGNPTLTFQEVVLYYNTGKDIIHILHDVMRR